MEVFECINRLTVHLEQMEGEDISQKHVGRVLYMEDSTGGDVPFKVGTIAEVPKYWPLKIYVDAPTIDDLMQQRISIPVEEATTVWLEVAVETERV